ncbi:MAG: transporter substrate-binding domain-containing protein [Cyanobacteria bacterium P01_H01_bin.15]
MNKQTLFKNAGQSGLSVFAAGTFLLGILLGGDTRAAFAQLSEIQKRGRLIVGVKDNTPPLGFIDDTGNLTGLEIEIAQRIAQELLSTDLSVELQPLMNQDRLPYLLAGEVDLVIANLALTQGRSRLIHFSRPYYLSGIGLITEKDAMTPLQPAAIAVLENSQSIALVKQAYPQARLIGVDSYSSAVETLESGQAEALAGDRAILAGWVQNNPRYVLSSQTLSLVPLAIAMPKGQQFSELQRAVDEILVELNSSGWLEERTRAWGLP